MAFDGMMMRLVLNEIEDKLVDSRIDRVLMPSRDEIVLLMHGYKGSYRLLMSAAAQSPRIHLTELSMENPKQPPMFCMLLRKHLNSAKLISARQNGLERVIYLDFETINELGDTVVITLAAEIMGRYSNVVLFDAQFRIIDSLKRIGADRSSVRQVLPGLEYELPPSDGKQNPLDGMAAIERRLEETLGEGDDAKALFGLVQGLSPLLSREICLMASCDMPFAAHSAGDRAKRICSALSRVVETVTTGSAAPTMLLDKGVPKDFSFLDIKQYGEALSKKYYDTIGRLLDAFYGEKDAVERMKQRMGDLSRQISTRIERIERKLMAQKEDLLACAKRDELRAKGDIISANLYQLKKGQKSVVLPNFYAPDNADIEIKLDPLLTPVENYQRYYKDYRRLTTAERVLKEQIEKGEEELDYLESVADMLSRARSDAELTAIREELFEAGYLKRVTRTKRRESDRMGPIKYRSSDGFLIVAGRNNLQNDRLTLKEAERSDMWFHVQKQPGSHVLVMSHGEKIPDRTLTEAAVIAAVNSRARRSANVMVDYTQIRYVKKRPGGKPGMVIYTDYKTAVVTPDEALAQSLMEK